MFSANEIWKQIQEYLPLGNRLSEVNLPSEKTVRFKEAEIRYDEYLPKAGCIVICPDLPGYGYTKTAKPYDYSTWVDVGSFIVKREIESGFVY